MLNVYSGVSFVTVGCKASHLKQIVPTHVVASSVKRFTFKISGLFEFAHAQSTIIGLNPFVVKTIFLGLVQTNTAAERLRMRTFVAVRVDFQCCVFSTYVYVRSAQNT